MIIFMSYVCIVFILMWLLGFIMALYGSQVDVLVLYSSDV